MSLRVNINLVWIIKICIVEEVIRNECRLIHFRIFINSLDNHAILIVLLAIVNIVSLIKGLSIEFSIKKMLLAISNLC
jgi:uncharacterized membrane protein